MLFLVSIIFFLNDTANTEIYTYCHTLSLHDALPIYLPGLEDGAATAPSVVAAAAGASPGWRRASLFVEQDDDVSAIGQTGLPCIMGTVMTRSEEHKSELQSIMRNSNVVFCLKKKIQK